MSALTGASVADAGYETETLQGGTLGEVCRVSGTAVTEDGERPYALVVKTQRRWERHGDPQCWRREHDLYAANIVDDFPGPIKLPRCLLLEEEDGLTRIWMEYVEGATGTRLQIDELALAAERLGSFQGAFHLKGRKDWAVPRGYPAVRSSYDLYQIILAGRLREPIAGFPDALRHILNGYADRAADLMDAFDALPLTLCQGDVHQDNIILREEANGTAVYLIDWDCAGYGRMGEDAVDMLMEAFVYSDREVSLLPAYRRRIIDSYCAGARTQGADFELNDSRVRELSALAWGFRVANRYLEAGDEGTRRRCVEILHAMLA